jgi:hypothetical protein
MGSVLGGAGWVDSKYTRRVEKIEKKKKTEVLVRGQIIGGPYQYP